MNSKPQFEGIILQRLEARVKRCLKITSIYVFAKSGNVSIMSLEYMLVTEIATNVIHAHTNHLMYYV